MNKSFIYYSTVLCSIFLGLWYSCASPGSIQGGPKDETPPKVDSAASSPIPVVHFMKKDIVVTFNEWVKLDDPFNQIFISPPPEHRPQFKLRKKSLIISFSEDEVLRDSTTYIINLGTAVKDITESNPLADFQYVFSTGDKLDSLGFSGTVTDILTGEPVENVSVMLYDRLEDSAIVTLPPAYFVRTGKDGRFKFDYLRPDTFQLIGYIDDDLDFRYNEETEPLGFFPEVISTQAVNGGELSFSLSIGPPPPYLDKADTSFQSLVVLNYDQPVTDSARLKIETIPGIRKTERLENRIRIYYDPDSLPIRIITKNLKEIRDTIDIRSLEKKEFTQKELEFSRVGSTLLPGKSLQIRANWPVSHIEKDLITVMKRDSTFIQPDTLITDFNTISLRYPWEADSSYTLILYPGAIRLENDLTNDTLEYKAQPVSPEKLASLIVTLFPEEGYVLPPQFILQLKEKDKVLKTVTARKTDEKITFSELKSGNYSLTVIRDENKNGIWDPARYPGRSEAEQMQTIEIENLRANWVQETEIRLTHSRK